MKILVYAVEAATELNASREWLDPEQLSCSRISDITSAFFDTYTN